MRHGFLFQHLPVRDFLLFVLKRRSEFFMRLATILLPVVLVLAACAGAPEAEPDTNPTNYAQRGFAFSTPAGLPTRIVYFVALRERDGMAAVCGGAIQLGAGQPRIAQRFFQGAAAKLDDRLLVRNLGYILSTDFEDVGAACRKTDLPWSPNLQRREPEIEFPSSIRG